jgi:hypothetical protein
MLERIKQIFTGDHSHDHDRREQAPAHGVDRRGTGDETAEHPPTSVARPEEAGHTPEPVVAGGRVPANEPERMAEERRGDSLVEERRVRAGDRGTSEGARMRREGQGDMAPEDQRWFAGDEAPRDSAYHPDPPNRNPARDQARSLEEESQILANDIVGQKPTTEGTAGRDWQESPQHPRA